MRNCFALFLGLLAIIASADAESRERINVLLQTRGVESDDLNVPLPEYPRPQLVREKWENLNGKWQYAIRPVSDESIPATWDGDILVPFPVESRLSGVNKPLQPDQFLWYRRTFKLPDWPKDRRVRLNFGAVDYDAEVFINGQKVGEHIGGYTPFSFDITEKLSASAEQEVVVRVRDQTDKVLQVRGKQSLKPGDIFYTAVSGIWQTVWLEPVPENAVESLEVIPDIDQAKATFVVKTAQPSSVELTVVSGRNSVAHVKGESGKPIEVPIPNPRLWTPDEPNLYDVRITAGSDTVDCYFGMRKISVGKDEKGFNRLLLNNKPVFQCGVLDQGYWPDGLYTAPSDDALKYDIEMAKRFGFNLIRKHMKVEAARWYYWADRLGILVWQDQPSMMSEKRESVLMNKPDLSVPPEAAEQFRKELAEMMGCLQNNPSIVTWVPFNEGWGQHDTNEILQWTMQLDPTRLVDGPSGWVDRGIGHIKDWHRYGGAFVLPKPDPNRVLVLGEYGGIGIAVPDHAPTAETFDHYRVTSKESLLGAYTRLLNKVSMMVPKGVSASIYTQLSDVEQETNGLMTADRKVSKVDPGVLANLNQNVTQGTFYLKTKELIPTSHQALQRWRYTFDDPGSGWMNLDFDDTKWREGEGGFGSARDAYRTIGTSWKSSDIWMRRVVELDPKSFHNPQMLVLHDDDAEIYVNGVKVLELTGYTNWFEPMLLSPGAVKAFRPGKNLIAVHCRNRKGGQFIDIGIGDWDMPKPQEEVPPKL